MTVRTVVCPECKARDDACWCCDGLGEVVEAREALMTSEEIACEWIKIYNPGPLFQQETDEKLGRLDRQETDHDA